MKRKILCVVVFVGLAFTVFGQELNSADEYFNRGVAYYRKGDRDQAIADFTEVIRLDPSNVDNNLKILQLLRDESNNEE